MNFANIKMELFAEKRKPTVENVPVFLAEPGQIVDELSEDATWDDLMYKIYVRLAIEAGLEDSKAERTMGIKKVRAKYGLPRGVEFISPPQERPYGIEAILKDDSGNWFSMTQHTED